MAHTSFVTARITSNLRTHGVRFAVEVEIKRFKRMGRSHEAAISCALAQVSSIIRMRRAA